MSCSSASCVITSSRLSRLLKDFTDYIYVDILFYFFNNVFSIGPLVSNNQEISGKNFLTN